MRANLTLILSAVMACTRLLAADQLALKSGTKLEGEIVEERTNENSVAFNSGKKVQTFPRSEVSECTRDEETHAEFARRAKAIKSDDAESHYALFKWAQEQKLYESAAKALHTALAANPDHKATREALGLPEDVQVNVTPAEDAQAIHIAAQASEPASREERVAFQEGVLEKARKLAATDTPSEQRDEIVEGFVREKERVAEVLLGALDFRRIAEAETRMGAVLGLHASKPQSPRISPTLAWSAVSDPSKEVRGLVTALIKDRKDDAAVGGIIRHLIGAFNEDGQAINAAVRDNAVSSLRALDDARIEPTLFRYCVMELRPTVTEGSLTTRAIQSFTVLTGAQVTIVIPLTFPIEFPEITIRRVRTTVSAPASAYRAYKGM